MEASSSSIHGGKVSRHRGQHGHPINHTGFTGPWSPRVTVGHGFHGTWRPHSPGSGLALHLHLSAGIQAAPDNPPPTATASPTRPGAHCHPAHPVPASPGYRTSSCPVPHISSHAHGLECAGQQPCAGGARPPAGGQPMHPCTPPCPEPPWLHRVCSALPPEQHRERGCAGSSDEPGLGKHHLPPTQPPTAPRPPRRPRRAGAHGEGAAGAGRGLRPPRPPTPHGQGRGWGRGWGSPRCKSRPGTGSCHRRGTGLEGQGCRGWGCPKFSPPRGTGISW